MTRPDRKGVFAQCVAVLVAAVAPFAAFESVPDHISLGVLVVTLGVLSGIVLVFGVLHLPPAKRWRYPLTAFVGATLFWGGCGKVMLSAREVSPRISCLSNVKQLGMGMLMYTADHDDHYPLASVWHTALVPYTKNEDLLHCPEATSPWSYAMSGSMSGVAYETIEAPELRVLLFEANAALPDASGGREWLAPRHKLGLAIIGFADSSAKFFTSETAAQLNW